MNDCANDTETTLVNPHGYKRRKKVKHCFIRITFRSKSPALYQIPPHPSAPHTSMKETTQYSMNTLKSGNRFFFKVQQSWKGQNQCVYVWLKFQMTACSASTQVRLAWCWDANMCPKSSGMLHMTLTQCTQTHTHTTASFPLVLKTKQIPANCSVPV